MQPEQAQSAPAPVVRARGPHEAEPEEGSRNIARRAVPARRLPSGHTPWGTRCLPLSQGIAYSVLRGLWEEFREMMGSLPKKLYDVPEYSSPSWPRRREKGVSTVRGGELGTSLSFARTPASAPSLTWSLRLLAKLRFMSQGQEREQGQRAHVGQGLPASVRDPQGSATTFSSRERDSTWPRSRGSAKQARTAWGRPRWPAGLALL